MEVLDCFGDSDHPVVLHTARIYVAATRRLRLRGLAVNNDKTARIILVSLLSPAA